MVSPRMTFEERAQEFHTDVLSLPRSGWYFWQIIPRKIFSSTNHKHTVARRDKTRPRSRIQKHFPESKTRPIIQKLFTKSETLPRFQKHVQNSKHVQNPKTLLRIQNTFQSPKHFPESKTFRSEDPKKPCNNPKHVPKTKNTFKNPNTSQKHFWILGSVLDSGTCFWILGSVLDSGTCFWILGRVLDFGKSFFILGRVMDSGKCFVPMRHGTNTTQIKAVTRVTVLICIPL